VKPKLLLSLPTSVNWVPKIGKILWDSDEGRVTAFRQRPPVISTDFPELEMRQYRAATFVIAPTPILAVDGQVLTDLSLTRQLGGTADLSLIPSASDLNQSQSFPSTYIEGTAFIACNEGSGTWGHWIGHNLPMALAFLRIFPEGRILLPSSYFSSSNATYGKSAILAGIPKEKIQLVRFGERYEIERLVTSDLLYRKGAFHPLAAELLTTLVHAVNYEPAQATFVRRMNPESRNIENMSDISAINRSLGIRESTADAGDLDAQIAIWTSSVKQISVLGSDLTNMAFVRESRVFALTPTRFSDNFFYGLAAMLGHEWNELYCGRVVQERKPFHKSSFHVELQHYENLIV